ETLKESGSRISVPVIVTTGSTPGEVLECGAQRRFFWLTRIKLGCEAADTDSASFLFLPGRSFLDLDLPGEELHGKLFPVGHSHPGEIVLVVQCLAEHSARRRELTSCGPLPKKTEILALTHAFDADHDEVLQHCCAGAKLHGEQTLFLTRQQTVELFFGAWEE